MGHPLKKNEGCERLSGITDNKGINNGTHELQIEGGHSFLHVIH